MYMQKGRYSPTSPAISLSNPENTRSQSANLSAVQSWTINSLSSLDMGMACFHFTASLYFFPAERDEAPTLCRTRFGWSARSRINRWPTEPVAPRTPHFFFVTVVVFDILIRATPALLCFLFLAIERDVYSTKDVSINASHYMKIEYNQ